MASDIVPIELCLTAGDLVTLWAPGWRVAGEEWEGVLGDDDYLFAFPDVASLVGFVRTASQHDLIDHPAWPLVRQLPATDLQPEDAHRYDLVGVPELAAESPDTWVLGELADVIRMTRSLADVCGLDVVHDVLDATPVFGMLETGTVAFSGREGQRRWDELGTVIAQRWEEVLDAVDAVISIPRVDPAAVATAQTELANGTEPATSEDDPGDVEPTDEFTDGPTDPTLAFWSAVGIDPIRIISSLGDHYTLRCYVDDVPVFLGRDGKVDVFSSPRALSRYLADQPGGHDLETVSTWPEVSGRAHAGELTVAVEEGNCYVLSGVAEDMAKGPQGLDPVQLDLAVELITDVEQWTGSDAADEALASSEPLGWLVSFVLQPDPTRLAPSPPFDAEVQAWRKLVSGVEDRLRVH